MRSAQLNLDLIAKEKIDRSWGPNLAEAEAWHCSESILIDYDGSWTWRLMVDRVKRATGSRDRTMDNP
jgi:hypothetical protein